MVAAAKSFLSKLVGIFVLTVDKERTSLDIETHAEELLVEIEQFICDGERRGNYGPTEWELTECLSALCVARLHLREATNRARREAVRS